MIEQIHFVYSKVKMLIVECKSEIFALISKYFFYSVAGLITCIAILYCCDHIVKISL